MFISFATERTKEVYVKVLHSTQSNSQVLYHQPALKDILQITIQIQKNLNFQNLCSHCCAVMLLLVEMQIKNKKKHFGFLK